MLLIHSQPLSPALPRRALRQARQPPPQASPNHHAWPPPASSPFFPYDCAPHASNTSLLLAALADGGGPSPPAFPPWVTSLCPEVVAHFTAFPYFPAFHRLLPASTTVYAAAGVCTLKVAAALATEEEEEEGGGAATSTPTPTRLMLHAGSHLGALLHGGPIPWDDDIDALLPWGARDRFLARCAASRHALHPAVTLECRVTAGAVKVFVAPVNGTASPAFSSPTRLGWAAPFVDLFLYKLVGGRLVEVAADTGALSPDKRWRAGQALPPRPAYFGGLALPAPPAALAAARYDLRTCVTAPWDHRHEEWLPLRAQALRLDCCALAAAGFPFVVWGGGAGGAGGGGPALLVAGRAGEGEARVLDLRRGRGGGPGGAAPLMGGATAATAALDADAEATPLVLVRTGGRAGAAAVPAPSPCGGGGGRLCDAAAAAGSAAASHSAAVTVAATLTGLAGIIGLAWWLPGRRRGGGPAGVRE